MYLILEKREDIAEGSGWNEACDVSREIEDAQKKERSLEGEGIQIVIDAEGWIWNAGLW